MYLRHCFNERSERRTGNWSMVITSCTFVVFHAVLLDTSHRQIACYKESVRSFQNTRKSLIKYRHAEIRTQLVSACRWKIEILSNHHDLFWQEQVILGYHQDGKTSLLFPLIDALRTMTKLDSMFAVTRLSWQRGGRGMGRGALLHILATLRIRCFPCQLFREGWLCKSIAPLSIMPNFMEISKATICLCVRDYSEKHWRIWHSPQNGWLWNFEAEVTLSNCPNVVPQRLLHINKWTIVHLNIPPRRVSAVIGI